MMKRPDAAKCEPCPFYRRGWLFFKDRCEFPLDPVPESCPIMREPRVMSWDEAMAAEAVWLELRGVPRIEMLVPVEIHGDVFLQGIHDTHMAGEVAPRKRDGIDFRFWDGRPGEELRESVAWKEVN